jgi:hypothetical protein
MQMPRVYSVSLSDSGPMQYPHGESATSLIDRNVPPSPASYASLGSLQDSSSHLDLGGERMGSPSRYDGGRHDYLPARTHSP